jgi:dihydroorotate dehydrogenase
VSRERVKGLPHAGESGGLSGAPIRQASTEVIRALKPKLGEIPIIGVGGIASAADAKEKIAAGASLVQLYTGFIYEGPSLIREIVKQLK